MIQHAHYRYFCLKYLYINLLNFLAFNCKNFSWICNQTTFYHEAISTLPYFLVNIKTVNFSDVNMTKCLTKFFNFFKFLGNNRNKLATIQIETFFKHIFLLFIANKQIYCKFIFLQLNKAYFKIVTPSLELSIFIIICDAPKTSSPCIDHS